MRDARVVFFLVAAFIIVGGCGGGGGDSGTPAVVKATVSGTVLDSWNNPVPAATVTINSTPVTTSTNSSGYFSAQIETGDHEIIVGKAGYSIFNTGFSVPSGSPVNLGTLRASGFYPAYLDSDGDTYGDSNSAMFFSTDTLTGSYVADGSDCDDANSAINPGASEVCNNVDDNCSGVVDDGNPGGGASCGTGLPGVCSSGTETCQGGSLTCVQNIIASAEICDGLDNDCDGIPDEGNPGSGAACITGLLGVCSSGTTTCQGGSLDCVQDVVSSPEICDGLDNDCNGTPDNGLVQSTFYEDFDADSFGNVFVTTPACAAPMGYVADSTDCNDRNAAVYPGRAESCDGIDNNCDGTPDEGLATSTHYRDWDEDGYGDANLTSEQCGPHSGYLADNTDCNDFKNTIHPGAPEVCDGDDNDCDTFTDEDPPMLYADVDVDGFGTSGTTILACSATGYVPFGGDCDDTNAAINPLIQDICGDAIDQDCSGADLSCPSYPLTASTIGPLQQGDYWAYSVSGDDTGTFTKTITASNIVSPETSENCTVVSLYSDLDTYGPFLSYDYYSQDIDGTIRICGYDEGGGSDWVAAKDGGNYTFYASPLAVGQIGSGTFSFDTPGAEGAYSYTVDSIQSVQTPAGLFSAYKIFQTYYEFWPGAIISEDEEYFEVNTSWLSPGIGEVQYESQMLDFIGTGLTPTSTFHTLNSLTGASYFGTSSCGPTGPGSGQLSQLSGTWAGTGNDHFISAGINWTDYEVSVTMNGSGNITSIILNGTNSGFTGIATAVDDSLYTIEFNDASTGQLLVDSTFNYMVFIKNYSFISGDMSFSVLQKGASGKRAGGYDKNLAVALYSGFGYDYCTSSSTFYRFSPASLNVMAESSGSLAMPVEGIGPNGFFNGNILLWQNIYGWWNGFESGSGDLHLFLSPDGLFAGAYHQVRGFFYVWPSEFAFYAMQRQ